MSELSDLAASLSRANAAKAVIPVVQKAAVSVKGRMRAEAAGHRHAKALPSSITYDSILGGLGFEAGPRRGAVGSLAFYYFGNSKVNASIPDPVVALRAEAVVAERFMAEALVKQILKGV